MNDQNLEEDLEIKKASGKILAGYVVAYRSLGMFKTRSIKCMEELMLRRANGDDFDFETYIEDQLKEIPKPNDLKKISEYIKGVKLE